MSVTTNGPEAQNALFERSNQDIPPTLTRANLRLEFPPSYVFVGVYRLFTDPNLYKPAWDKCKHAARRGAIVGAVWAFLTFKLQKKIIEIFLMNSPRITGLSSETVFGFRVPFKIQTYAAVMVVGLQVTHIMQFFLRRNIGIARDRAWDQTVASRGKGPEFWKPYVEEWENPPIVQTKQGKLTKWLQGRFVLLVVKYGLLAPLSIYPFGGVVVSAWFKALGTAHGLHRRYFTAKGMSEQQIATFVEERKWDYRVFGFAAALLEGFPIVGLAFTVSNRVGAAMWAHDLEKRQHYIAQERLQGHFSSSKKT